MPSFDQYIHKTAGNRATLQTVFFLLALFSLLLNYQYNILLHQLGRTPILSQDVDPTYWAFMIMGLPDFFSTSGAIFLDVILIGSCIASIVWNRGHIAPLVFFVSHFFYFITYNMMAGHHYLNIGMLVVSFAFMFRRQEKFAAAFSFCRLIFCFMMVAAGLWKVVRGNLFYPDQAHMLLVSTHIQSLVTGDASLRFQLIGFFISNKLLGHLLWLALIGIEVFFIWGFITTKKDKKLLMAYLLFAIGGWFFFNIYNFENTLFLLTLTPVIHGIEKGIGSWQEQISNRSASDPRISGSLREH